MSPLPTVVVVAGSSAAAALAQDQDLPSGKAAALHIITDTISSHGSERADEEITRAEHIVSRGGTVAVVGHLGSRGSLAAAPVYNRAGVLQIVPTGTSRLLRRAGPWTFTLAPDDSAEGSYLGRFAAEALKAHTAVIFYVPDEYGDGLRRALGVELRRRGVLLLDEVPIVAGSDLPTLVKVSLARTTPDVILSAVPGGQTGEIARIALPLVPHARIVAGDAAADVPELQRTAGPATDSVYFASFWLPDSNVPASRAFIQRFRARTGRAPSATDALVFDAVMLLRTAVAETAPVAGPVRRYLLELGEKRPAYSGVTGPITFRSDRPVALHMARARHGEPMRVDWP